MKDLKENAIRGGFAKLCAQMANAMLQIGSLMILARLLSPSDFGLIAMVMSLVGVLNLFRDFGLSTATVQRTSVTDEQISTLFWINILVALTLTCVALVCAPLVAVFYHEPRLLLITTVLAFGFLINATGIQHSALLQRQMRFAVLALIETLSLLTGVAVGIGMAFLGVEYWALVGMTLTTPAIYSASVWFASGWIPGPPRRRAGIGSMVRTGGIVTANGLVAYAAYNLEKVLLGRFWGADALGIYGRAYQLINIPTENLNSAVGGVVLSVLSRVKEEPDRLRNYFLKGYSLLVAVTLPITAACALFSNDLIFVMLGPQWSEAAPIFRLLAPTILIFGMINPLWPLMLALGLLVRSFKMALVLAPLVMAGYLIGLPWGPKGVALGFSIAMTLWVVPHIAWGVHGTVVSLKDIMTSISRPLLSTIVASIPAAGVAFFLFESASPLLRLIVGILILVFVYVGMLLYVMNQRALYLDVIRGLKTG